MIFYISMDNFLFGNVAIKQMNLRDLPLKVQIWSYLMVFVPMLCIPAYAIYKLIITPGKDFDEVNKLISITNNMFFFVIASSTIDETRRTITRTYSLPISW
jgi:hypothetical protein